jgi:tryptophan halogenase
MIQSIIVLGGGSAGLIAALTLKRRLPDVAVRVVRSKEIGIIGVGEGTTAFFPKHLFEYLKLSPRQFYMEAEPTWKLGLRFIWGPRDDFFYNFTAEHDHTYPELRRHTGFYQDSDVRWVGPISALMAHDKAFPRRFDGNPDFSINYALHIENAKLVRWLENTCRAYGVEISEGTMSEVERADHGIVALRLENGERVAGDFFVDASGFRAELVGRVLGEPKISYANTLFCDRAIIGGWPRTDEPIHPYTLCETMDAGWCWQIEHEHWINRGYVYCSRFLDDDSARAELLRKNPKIANEPRLVKFPSFRLVRHWVGNVVAIGNASGFVEPLEATALSALCVQSRTVAETLLDSGGETTPSMIRICNELNANAWDDIRDFLAVHYAFNTRLNTPFWEACRAEVDLAGAARIVEYYRENGPTSLGKHHLVSAINSFGLDGYLALLVGQMVPYERTAEPSPAETKAWRSRLALLAAEAKRGFTVSQILQAIRSPSFKW